MNKKISVNNTNGQSTEAAKDHILNILRKQDAFFATGRTKEIDFRLKSLVKFKKAILAHEKQLFAALKSDINRSDFESFVSSIMMVTMEIDLMVKNLKKWTRPKKVRTPLMISPAKSSIRYEPFGKMLVIGAWNAPVIVTLLPLVGILAAGNTAVIKPSELAPESSKVMKSIVSSCFPEDYCAAIEGGVEETTLLLDQRFDFIVYTGSTQVGKIVAAKAAKYLTPTLLELGGKSPCIVDKNVNIEVASRRIAWTKYTNAGQICTAPDYLVIHKDIKDEFLAALKKRILEFYGEDPSKSPDYAKIINKRHFDRLSGLLLEGKIIHGGRTDREKGYMEPVILDTIGWDSTIMEEEIFGPILPVIEYENLDEVLTRITKGEKPLALYVYTENKKLAEKVLSSTTSGGAGVNASVIHFLNQNLPFGGVGNSGMGNYHGRASIDTFSHKKSVINKTTAFDPKMIYAPYEGKLKLLKKFFK